MCHLTFGEIQRRATAAGLVMSRRGVLIHLRMRGDEASLGPWTGLDATGALRIVEAVEHGRDPDKGP